MPEQWTGDLVGKMHLTRVTQQDLADEMGVTKSYVNMILSGARTPKGAQERLERAFDDVRKKKAERP